MNRLFKNTIVLFGCLTLAFLAGHAQAAWAPAYLLLAFLAQTDDAREVPWEPANLDLEEGKVGEVPSRWFAPVPGYKVQLTDEQPKSGKYCAVISREGQEKNERFGNLMQSFDAKNYRGKRVCLRAAVRAEVAGPGNQAQLWLRVDRKDHEMGFFDNMDDRPIVSNEWRDYEIVGDVAEDAEAINFGMILVGSGRTWLDAVSFKVIGKADEGNEPARPLEDRGLLNLIAFAKLLGYVRYFHPSDQAAKTDWDRFAIDGVQTVENAKNPTELAQVLEKLFQPIAPSVRVYSEGAPPKDPPGSEKAPSDTFVFWCHSGVGLGHPISIYSSMRVKNKEFPGSRGSNFPNVKIPDPGKPFTAGLGGGVQCRLPLALYTDSQGTLPQATVPLSASPKPKGFTPSGNDRSTRLAAVILAWNVFQHFYPYFDVVKADWPAELRQGLTRAATDPDKCAFLTTLRLLVAGLHDGHGSVGMHGDSAEDLFFPPLQWDWIENKLVATWIGAKGAGSLKPGDVILKVNGRPAETALTDLEQFISGATPQWKRNRSLWDFAQGAEDSDITLDVAARNGCVQTVHVRRNFDLSSFQHLQVREPRVAEVEDGIMYVDLSRVTEKRFDEVIPKLAKAKGIIFDMREYPRAVRQPIAHLIERPVTSPQWQIPVTLYPDRQDVAFEFSNWEIRPEKPHFEAKIAFLTGGGAISAAETFLGIIEHYKLAAIVGAPTAGTNGNINPFMLPGGYSVVWTGMKVLKHDGSRHHGVGIQPTVPVAPTILGVAEGRDEVLDRAIKAVKP